MVAGRVLLLAAHAPLDDGLVPQLQAEGFTVEIAATADEASAAAADQRLGVRVAVVDVAIGADEARQACGALYAQGVPTIVFSTGGPDADLVEFLEWGADDYLPRPDRLRELVARIRALIRRVPVPGSGAAAPSSSPDVLIVGEVMLDAARHEVTVRGVPVELPLKQFQLLELFLSNPGQVLQRSTILRRVWGSDSVADSNTLEVQIKRLRKQIEDDPTAPKRIRTIRGLGYLYADDR